MPTMWLSDQQKAGVVFCSAGVFFFAFGVLCFFDRSMLAMGNILFIVGLPLILGLSKTIAFFARRQKWSGTLTFATGISLILYRWPLLGFCVETYGLFVLFGDFMLTLATFVRGIPFVGPYLAKALAWVGTVGGRKQPEAVPV